MGLSHDRIVHLTQARLLVHDFDAVFRFYRDVIGLTPMADPPAFPYAAFTPDLGSALCLHDRAALAADLGGALRVTGERGPDQSMVVLRVDDLAAYLSTLAAHVVAGPVEHGGRVRAAYVRDPDGNLVELQQWLTTRDGGPVPSAG